MQLMDWIRTSRHYSDFSEFFVLFFFFLKMITLSPCTLIDFSFYDLDDFFSLFKWLPVFCKLPKA